MSVFWQTQLQKPEMDSQAQEVQLAVAQSHTELQTNL